MLGQKEGEGGIGWSGAKNIADETIPTLILILSPNAR